MSAMAAKAQRQSAWAKDRTMRARSSRPSTANARKMRAAAPIHQRRPEEVATLRMERTSLEGARPVVWGSLIISRVWAEESWVTTH